MWQKTMGYVAVALPCGGIISQAPNQLAEVPSGILREDSSQAMSDAFVMFEFTGLTVHRRGSITENFNGRCVSEVVYAEHCSSKDKAFSKWPSQIDSGNGQRRLTFGNGSSSELSQMFASRTNSYDAVPAVSI